MRSSNTDRAGLGGLQTSWKDRPTGIRAQSRDGWRGTNRRLLARSGVAARAPRALGRAARDTGPLRGSARARAASAGVRSAIVAFAKSQIGLSSPAGSLCNPYSAYWHEGSGGCPNGWTSNWWCAEFAAWAWSKAGVSFPYGGPSDVNAFSASFYVWGSATGNWHPLSSGYQPQPGDVAVYGACRKACGLATLESSSAAPRGTRT